MKVIKLVQKYSNKSFPHNMCRCALVQIPKGDIDKRSIELTEALWKLVGKTLCERLGCINFHPSVHGFRVWKGTSTSIIKIKLLNTLSRHNNNTTFQVFLDLSKAYYTVSRPRLFKLLEQYGIDQETINILRYYWKNLEASVKKDFFWVTVFKPERGLMKGYILSPILFNFIIDSVVWKL